MISTATIARSAATAVRSARSIHTATATASSGSSIAFRNVARSWIRSTAPRVSRASPATLTLRPYSSSSSSSTPPRSKIRSLPLTAIALILGGLTLTSAGLWQFYTSGVNAFPEGPIRDDLRKAIYYQNYGDDPERAVKYYRSALNAAMHHPDLKVDGPEVTGIMIQLGTMFQDMGRTRDAIDVLVMAFECLVHGRTLGMDNETAAAAEEDQQQRKTGTEAREQDYLRQDELAEQERQEQEQELKKRHGVSAMDGPTRLKTVGIAQKLGDLYHSIKKDEQAERYYLWSVEQLLKNHEAIEARVGSGAHYSVGHDQTNSISEEERLQNARDHEAMRKQFNFENLPSWMSKTDLGASLEALAGFYASKGIFKNALPLYMRALSLIEPGSCHAAVLMCNISDAFAGLGNVEDATGWAERGLKVGSKSSGQECDEGCGVLLYNLGMLHEMKGDILKAQDYYKQSKQHGLKTGFDRCIVESNKALRRIKEGNEGKQS